MVLVLSQPRINHKYPAPKPPCLLCNLFVSLCLSCIWSALSSSFAARLQPDINAAGFILTHLPFMIELEGCIFPNTIRPLVRLTSGGVEADEVAIDERVDYVGRSMRITMIRIPTFSVSYQHTSRQFPKPMIFYNHVAFAAVIDMWLRRQQPSHPLMWHSWSQINSTPSDDAAAFTFTMSLSALTFLLGG